MKHAALMLLLMAAMAVFIPMAAAGTITADRQTHTGPQSAPQPVEVQNPPVSQAQTEDTEERLRSSSAAPQAVQLREFKVYDRATGEVLTLSADEYIRGAVASEMPASFHQQALNAQAAAAHTWAVYSGELQMLSPDEELHGADFSVDSARCEGYMTKERFFERYGVNAELLWPKICEAAEFAIGKVVTFEGETALTAYHSASAGMTERSENVWQTALPYLVPVESEGDKLSPDYSVTETYDQKTMKLLLGQQFPEAVLDDGDPAGWIKVLETSPSGYVTLADVGGEKVHGQQVRTALELRSSCFDIKYGSGTFTVITKGYGHGVGMSQYGADFMARQGSGAEDILLHYYPGCELTPVSQ